MKTSVTCIAVALGALPLAAAADPAVHHQTRMEGEGPMTVVLESGLGDTLEVWHDLQPHIAAHCARTISYTRAGYLGSDPPDSGPRDSATVVAELRAELRGLRLEPPYVLVGHSLGGLYMQYFARNYPNEVAGLVLVDSTHWNQQMKVDGPRAAPYMAGRMVTVFMPWIMRRELTDSIVAGEQVHESPQASRIPTVVLSSTIGPKGETPAARAAATSMQEEIAADFPGARHIQVSGAGHYIQRERPEAVVEAARQLAGCDPFESAARDSVAQAVAR